MDKGWTRQKEKKEMRAEGGQEGRGKEGKGAGKWKRAGRWKRAGEEEGGEGKRK